MDIGQLNEAMINSFIPTDENVDTRIFGRLLEEKRVVASYKMYWLLGILEEVNIGNKEITFKRIISRMIIGAWYPTLQFKLYFGQFDNLKTPINYLHQKYGLKATSKPHEILDIIEKANDKELNKMIKDLTNMVPYRLLSPFFENELKGLVDSKRNSAIIDASQNHKGCLYKIIKDKEDKIVVSDEWIRYLQFNYKVIRGWIDFKLACFLQKRNPNVPAIMFKLKQPVQRDLAKPKEIWGKIIQAKGVKDIYTGKEFTCENYENHGVLSIDHFIPWSFVMHDEMWNLVPTFKNINSSKNDKLLKYENYIDEFCKIQYSGFSYICDNKYNTFLEQYIDALRVEKIYDYYKNTNEAKFSEDLKKNIYPIYQIAENQGFGVIDFL